MKKTYRILGLALILAFSLCLLTACGGGSNEEKKSNLGGASVAGDPGDTVDALDIAGTAWEVDGIVYHFFEDGVVATDTGYILSYIWDGIWGEVSDEDITVEMIYDEDGFFMEGEDETFYPLAYVGDADASLLGGRGDDFSETIEGDADASLLGGRGDDFSETIDLENTSWEIDGNTLHFFADGVVATSDGGVLSYSWDGSHGEVWYEDDSLEIAYNKDGFFVEMNDSTFYKLNYAGEADPSLLEDEIESPYGAYDNDEVSTSIVFYSDGTCVVSTLDTEADGIYTVDADGYLYIETDYASLGGWYDADEDTFTMDDTAGHFYYVGSPYYVP